MYDTFLNCSCFLAELICSLSYSSIPSTSPPLLSFPPFLTIFENPQPLVTRTEPFFLVFFILLRLLLRTHIFKPKKKIHSARELKTDSLILYAKNFASGVSY